jgi:hypothetical protein
MISIAEAAAPVIDNLRRVVELRELIEALDRGAGPAGMPVRRWHNLLDDSAMFFADDPGWGLLALDLGWTPRQLLGANRTKPYARIDQQGLLWLVAGNHIEYLDEAGCVLITRSNSFLTYRARPHPLEEICMPWEFT